MWFACCNDCCCSTHVAAPTLSPRAPSMTVAAHSAVASSIALSVELGEAAVYGGTLYCAAFVDGTTVSSVGKVKSAGVAVSYSTGTTTLSVTVEGLVPLTAYSAYCYVKNVLGIGSSLTEVLDTQTAVRTACCKTIEFTNAPTRVYGDPTTYTLQQRNQYTFSYALSSAPSEELRVGFTVASLNTTSARIGSAPCNDVVASPALHSFSPSSQQQGSSLSRSFILRAADAFAAGSCAIQVSLSGPSVLEYEFAGTSSSGNVNNGTSVAVEILAAAAVPPAPTMTRSQFSSTGASAYIYFDSLTNRAGLQSVSWNCAEVFQFVSAATSVCSWLNNSAVQVIFDYSSSTSTTSSSTSSTSSSNFGRGGTARSLQSAEVLQVGDPIALVPSVIRAACPNGFTASTCASTFDSSPAQSVTAAAPANPVVPSVVISVPSVTVGSCSNVSVDASQSTGSGGRDWEAAVWVVSASQQDASSILRVQSIFDAGGTSQTQQYEIPSDLLVSGAIYSLSLSLTNFLGKSGSSSATFAITTDNPNTPLVRIIGPKTLRIKASQILVVHSSASRASCAEDSSSALQFTWRLRNEGNQDEDFYRVASTSSNPTILKLAPYTLRAGQVYEAQVTVTASATASHPAAESSAAVEVFVESGDLVAFIAGGSRMLIPIEDTLTLDASGSYDADTGINEGLTFLWACTLTNVANFGEPCASSVLENAAVSSSVLVINGSSLPITPVEHTFEVLVSSATVGDDRTASAQVSVLKQGNSSQAVAIIASTPVRLNADDALVISGFLRGSYGLAAEWVVFFDGEEIPVESITPILSSFEESIVETTVAFPLSIPGGVLVPGSIVTLRLVAVRESELLSRRALQQQVDSSSSNAVYSEITIVVNVPPSGGSFSVAPPRGEALVTPFRFLALGWTDEPQDLPLSYRFAYQIMSGQPELEVGSLSTSNTIVTDLPPGLSSFNFGLTVVAEIFDLFEASTMVTSAVTATIPVNIDLQAYLDSKLEATLSSGDINIAFSGVNNVASTINAVDCSQANASFCAGLNRDVCFDTTNTCSECLEGFTGKVGSFNTLCFPTSRNSTEGSVGSPCEVGSDCLLGSCKGNVCSIPITECPSNTTMAICSGHGACIYTDNSGQVLKEGCNIFDTSCSAACRCSDGFGGADCSLSPAAALARDELRTTLCNTIDTIRNISDASSLLLESLVGSLLVSYVPAEVVSSVGVGACEGALLLVTKLAADGLLTGTSASTTDFLVQSTAEFVTTAGAGASTSGTKAGAVVTDALAGVAAGVLLAMVPGQSDVVVATDGLRFTAVNALASTVTALRPPLTGAEAAYGSEVASAVEFISGSGAACNTGLGYAELSVVQWGATPYEGADSLETPQLQFQSQGSATVENNRLRRLLAQRLVAGNVPAAVSSSWSRKHSRGLANDTAATPAYFLTFLFNQQQRFDLSIRSELLGAEDPTSIVSNATFPDCTQFSIESGYSPCQGCVVSSYNNINVTYSCFDVAQLCPGVGSNRRLQGDDDGDDFLSGDTSAASSVQYAALINTLDSVLSTNPFSLDLQQNSSVVIFLSVLVGIILIGFVYFRRWDVYDHHVMLYAKKERQGFEDALPPKQRLHSALRSLAPSSRDSLTERWARKHAAETNMDTPQKQNSSLDFIGSILASPLSLWSTSYDADQSFRNERSIQLSQSSHKALPSAARAGSSPMRPLRGLGMSMDSSWSAEVHNSVDLNLLQTTSFDSSGLLEYDPVTEDISCELDLLGLRAVTGAGSSWDPSSPRAQYVRATVEDFLGSVLPEDAQGVSQSSTPVTDFVVHILMEHDFTGMFFGESLQMPRMIRWARLCMSVLIIIFIDTLFFSTFFPDTGECESYETQQDCETPTNEGLDAPLCEWEETSNANGGECSLKDTPEDLVFTMVLVMLTMIVGVPLVLVFDALLAAYCPLRPDLDAWGLTASWWLSRPTQSIAIEGDVYLAGKDGSGDNEGAVKSSAPLKQLYDEIDEQRTKAMHNPQLSSVQKMAAQQRRQRAELRELDFVTHNLLYEYSSPLEEAQHMVSGARHLLEQYYTSASSARPFACASDSVGPVLEAKVHAVQDLLGIYPDGTPVPLTLWELLRYGTPLRKLESRVRAARAKAQDITDLLDGLGAAATSAQDQDVALIQYFAFEQFTPFKRFILQSSFFDFPNTSPQTISTSVWLAAWALVIAAYLFFLYWILVWGISSGNKTLNTWALNFGLALLEDIFVIQVVRIYVLVILAFVAVRPQLRSIYRVLYSVAIEYAQERPATALKASEFKVVQHLSAACRAARQSGYLHLASTTILHRVDDVHERDCRRASKYGVPLAAAALIFFPVVIGAVHELMGDLVFEAILPLVLNSFILANSFLYAVSILLLVLPYALLVFLYWWVYKLYPSASRQALAAQERSRQAFLIRTKSEPSMKWALRRRRGTAWGRVKQWWGSVVDAGAVFVHSVTTPVLRVLGYTIGEDGAVRSRSSAAGDEDGDGVLSVSSRGLILTWTWRGMNLPGSLQAMDSSPAEGVEQDGSQTEDLAADLEEDMAEELQLLVSLPREVQTMLAAATVRDAWNAKGRAPKPRPGQQQQQGDKAAPSVAPAGAPGSSDFAVRLLNTFLCGGGDSLLPQRHGTQAGLQFAPPLYVDHTRLTHTSKHTLDLSAASAYRSRFQSLLGVDEALLHLLTSYRQLVQLGQEVYISYLDQEELFQLSSTDLLLYGGQIHIVDLASLLQELLEWCDHQGWELTEHSKRLLLDDFRHWIGTGSALEPFDMVDEEDPQSHSASALSGVVGKLARGLSLSSLSSPRAHQDESAAAAAHREASALATAGRPSAYSYSGDEGEEATIQADHHNPYRGISGQSTATAGRAARAASAASSFVRYTGPSASHNGISPKAASEKSGDVSHRTNSMRQGKLLRLQSGTTPRSLGSLRRASSSVRKSEAPRATLATRATLRMNKSTRFVQPQCSMHLGSSQAGTGRSSRIATPHGGSFRAANPRVDAVNVAGRGGGGRGGVGSSLDRFSSRSAIMRLPTQREVFFSRAEVAAAASVSANAVSSAEFELDWRTMGWRDGDADTGEDPRTARCAVRFSAFARWLRTTILGNLRSLPSTIAAAVAAAAADEGEEEDNEDEQEYVLGVMKDFRYTKKHQPQHIP